VRDAIVTENNGVRWVEIRSEIGDQAVVANDKLERTGLQRVRQEKMVVGDCS
jgi:hypothetical protein